MIQRSLVRGKPDDRYGPETTETEMKTMILAAACAVYFTPAPSCPEGQVLKIDPLERCWCEGPAASGVPSAGGTGNPSNPSTPGTPGNPGTPGTPGGNPGVGNPGNGKSVGRAGEKGMDDETSGDRGTKGKSNSPSKGKNK